MVVPRPKREVPEPRYLVAVLKISCSEGANCMVESSGLSSSLLGRPSVSACVPSTLALLRN